MCCTAMQEKGREREGRGRGEEKEGALFSTWESIFSRTAAPSGLSPVCRRG